MTYIDEVAHNLADILKDYSADYLEARLEENESSYITYRGKGLESIGRSGANGPNIDVTGSVPAEIADVVTKSSL